ncbi:hypothetical protein V2A60_006380 [Cordyceps javanica]
MAPMSTSASQHRGDSPGPIQQATPSPTPSRRHSSSALFLGERSDSPVYDGSNSPIYTVVQSCNDCVVERERSESLKRTLEVVCEASGDLKRRCVWLENELHTNKEKAEKEAYHKGRELRYLNYIGYKACSRAERYRKQFRECAARFERELIEHDECEEECERLRTLTEDLKDQNRSITKLHAESTKNAAEDAKNAALRLSQLKETRKEQVAFLQADKVRVEAIKDAQIASLQADMVRAEATKDEEIAFLQAEIAGLVRICSAKRQQVEQQRSCLDALMLRLDDKDASNTVVGEPSDATSLSVAARNKVGNLVGSIDTPSERSAAVMVLHERAQQLNAERDAVFDKLDELQRCE